MPARDDFSPVFGRLRAILAEYEPKLHVVHDKPGNHFLDSRMTHAKPVQ